MKIRVGIVGPEDSVNLIGVVANEYNGKLYPVPFVYSNPEETTNIVQKNEQSVDLWIFSGVSPYTFAKKSTSKQPFFYLQLTASSLFQVLVKIGYKDGRSLDRISIDMLTERDVYETYHDLGIPHENLYQYEFPGYTPIQDILAYHQNLFKEGKVDVCVTCLSFIYEQLKSLGIPVYRVIPTRSNIRGTIETALQHWEALYFKKSQIAVVLIQIEKMEKSKEQHSASYGLHRLNLELQSTILDFSESISGSFVAIGIGTFLIFSTRGSLQETEQQNFSLLERLALITDLPTNIGIGYGETSMAAEENARLALRHAQNYGECCAFHVDSNGTIEGPLKEQQSISFGYRNENKEISEKLKQGGVTITAYNKIMSVQKRLGNHAITAANVAKWLKMTERNARRILNSLVEQKLAEIIGEEAPTKGRPRKIYRIGIVL